MYFQGKSTLALTLTDNENLIAQKFGGDYRIIQRSAAGPSPIGCRTTVSRTTFPEAYVDKAGVVYYDTPGFADSRRRTPHIDIANAMFMKHVADNAERLKVLVAVNYFSVRPSSDRNDFLETLVHLRNLFNTAHFKKGIGLVVTKVDHHDSDEEVVEYIAEFLLNVRAQLEETSPSHELEPRLRLLDELLSVHDDTGSYRKIAIFRKPTTEGVLSENTAIEKNKMSIRKMVDNMTWVKHTKEDVGYVLSENARLLTSDVHALLKTKTAEKIRKWSLMLQDKMTKSLDTLESLNLSERLKFEHNFEQSQLLVSTEKMVSAEQIHHLMSKFKPRVDFQGEEDIARYGEAMHFLERVDNRIGKSNWSEAHDVLFRAAAAISDNCKKLYDKKISSVQKTVNLMFRLLQTHLTEELTKLIQNDDLDEGDVGRLEKYLNKLKKLAAEPSFDNMDWFPGSALETEQRLRIDIDVLLFLGGLSSAETQKDPAKTVVELKTKAINATVLPVSHLLQKDVYPRTRTQLGNLLSQYVQVLKSGYTYSFPTHELSSMALLKDSIQTQLKCVLSHGEAVEKQKLTGTRLTMAQAFNHTLADLSCFKVHTTSCNTPEQRLLLKNMRFFARTIDMSAILDDQHLGGVVHNDLLGSQVWQPMRDFLKAFMSTLGDVTISRSESGEEVTIQGHILSLGETIEKIKAEPYYGSLRKLSLVALHTIFLDTKLNGAEMNKLDKTVVSIVSPIWWAAPGHFINLNGRAGEMHGNRSREPGEDGRPGLHGGNGGIFFGLGMDFRGTDLMVSARGGEGGSGEEGAMGMEGSVGAAVGAVGCRASGLEAMDGLDDPALLYQCENGGSCYNGGKVYIYRPGTQGNSGGHGGKGGHGGCGGQLLLFQAKPSSLARNRYSSFEMYDTQRFFEDGAVGQDGHGGAGGLGGMPGPAAKYRIELYKEESRSTDELLMWSILRRQFPHSIFPSSITRCRLHLECVTPQCPSHLPSTPQTPNNANQQNKSFEVRGQNGADGRTGGVEHHQPRPICPTYSISPNGQLFDALKMSTIKLTLSTEEDKKVLIQPVTVEFINSFDSLLSDVADFVSPSRLYEEYLSLEMASPVWSFTSAQSDVIVNIFKSLQTRVQKAQNGIPITFGKSATKALRFLETAVRGKLASIANAGPLLVSSVMDHTQFIRGNLLRFQTEVGSVARKTMIEALTRIFEEQIQERVKEVSKMLGTRLEPEVRIAMARLQTKQEMTEQEVRQNLGMERRTMFLHPARERTEELAVLKGLTQFTLASVKLGVKALLTIPFEPDANTTGSNQKSPVVGHGTGLGIFSWMVDKQQLEDVGTLLQDLQYQLVYVQEHKQQLGKASEELFVDMRIDLDAFTVALKSRTSSAALDLSKWEIHSFLGTVKKAIRTLIPTALLKSDHDVASCLQTMDNLLGIVIDLHNRVQQYRRQARLAELMADVKESTMSNCNTSDGQQLQKTIARTDSFLTTKMLLLGYRHAVSSFVLWAFPFAQYFEADFQLPRNGSEPIESVAFDVAQKLDVLEKNVKEFYWTIAPFDHIRHWRNFNGTAVIDSSNSHSPDSFYVIHDRSIISRLLRGERVLLRFGVDKAPPNMDAIKLRTLRIDFKSENKTLEAELLKDLDDKFLVNMTHMGDSHFFCSGKVSLGMVL